MRTTVLTLAFLLAAGSVAAQEQQPRADYSRDTLMRLFVASAPGEEPVVRYRDGMLVLRGFNGDTLRMGYLAPLSGSDIGDRWPDPFSLTRTQIATSPRAWRTRREIRRAPAHRAVRTREDQRQREMTIPGTMASSSAKERTPWHH